METKKKILIIEDEKPMAKALELKLNNSGFIATAVFNGQEGMNLIEKNKFDLILIDLVMPVMDGFTFLTEMKNKKIDIPVIVLSNLSQEEDASKAKNLGARDFFIKSNTPIAQIVTSVQKQLGQ